MLLSHAHGLCFQPHQGESYVHSSMACPLLPKIIQSLPSQMYIKTNPEKKKINLRAGPYDACDPNWYRAK